jgi:hypothetical protein
MSENTKISAAQKDIEHKKRICGLYGVCGRNSAAPDLHQISHFGLKRLNEKK